MTTPVSPGQGPHFPPSEGPPSQLPTLLTKRQYDDFARDFTGAAAYNKKPKTEEAPPPTPPSNSSGSSKSTDKEKETQYEVKQLGDTMKQDRQQMKSQAEQEKKNELGG